jgi:hypothetical protein
VFDDPNLVASAGLVPVMRLAARAGLTELTDRLVSVPTDKGANAGMKVASLVAGMVAGADSIDDLAMLRHGGMSRLFSRIYAPSTLGSPAGVPVRARPSARRGRGPVPARADRPHPRDAQ